MITDIRSICVPDNYPREYVIGAEYICQCHSYRFSNVNKVISILLKKDSVTKNVKRLTLLLCQTVSSYFSFSKKQNMKTTGTRDFRFSFSDGRNGGTLTIHNMRTCPGKYCIVIVRGYVSILSTCSITIYIQINRFFPLYNHFIRISLAKTLSYFLYEKRNLQQKIY